MSEIREVEIEGEVKAKTASAWLFDDGRKQVWLPLSKISDYCADRNGAVSSVFIPEWLATEKGLV